MEYNDILEEISIPEYYIKYINPKVDLDITPKICCPFHAEKTPSFSYDSYNGRWRCFGSCHKGGDVVALHQANRHFRSKGEAINDLRRLLGLRVRELEYNFNIKENNIEVKEIDELYHKAIIKVRFNKELALDLDYIMSKNPVDIYELEKFVENSL